MIKPRLPTVFCNAARSLVTTNVFELAASNAVKQNVSAKVQG
jgi:hypothetical protein